MSASSIVQYGPDKTRVKSSTVKPANGPLGPFDSLRSLRAGGIRSF
jgi:hypothetical protein